MTFLDCKDKKIKSKKQVLRFKIWQDEIKALPLHSFFIVLDLSLRLIIGRTSCSDARGAFFCP